MNARYTGVAIALHWAIALLILANFAIGMDFPEPAPGQKFAPKPLMPLHITIGISVLLLSLARLGWRLVHAPPPYAAGMARWEQALARAVHALFYGLIVGMPLTGWLILSANPRTDWLRGVLGFQWPRAPIVQVIPVDRLEAAHDLFAQVHVALSTWVLMAMLALHLGAIVKHHLIDKDPVLRRMWPSTKGDGDARREPARPPPAGASPRS